ncbi:hypothetical protein Tco_0678127 [Tanacetum coccineum]|uniref:Uncharacterized protein n=1 Tax=Tanacetum coccineum TaxID=301880 RepID=A0ABQ4XF18_9ASTR
MSLRNLIWFCGPIQLDDDDDGNIEDNEQLANAIQESLKPELPPQNNYGNVFPPLPWHFRNDLYASQFQQSGSVTTEGTRTNCFYASQSSSMAHKQFLTTHHLNTDPDAEQYQSFAHTLSTPTIQNIDVDRIAKPQNHPFNFATQRHKRCFFIHYLLGSNLCRIAKVYARCVGWSWCGWTRVRRKGNDVLSGSEERTPSREMMNSTSRKDLEDCYSSSSFSLLMIQAVDLREDASWMLG